MKYWIFLFVAALVHTLFLSMGETYTEYQWLLNSLGFAVAWGTGEMVGGNKE